VLVDSAEGIRAGVPLGPIEGRKLDGTMHIGEIPTLFSSLLPPEPLSSPTLTIVDARYPYLTTPAYGSTVVLANDASYPRDPSFIFSPRPYSSP
jgi:hypothetical protein